MQYEVAMIVPVYKGEKFLPKFLQSVCKQTYKNFVLVLVVDFDAENDQAKQICQDFAAQHPFAKLILNPPKNRKGVSHARNIGLDAVLNCKQKPKWICFADADDWLEKDYLALLVNAIKTTDADIAFCKADFYRLPKICMQPRKKLTYYAPPHKIIKQMFTINGAVLACWDKLFCASLIGTQRFDETLHIGEDAHFGFCYLAKCKSAAQINQKLYHYRIHSSSSIHSKFSLKKLDDLNAFAQIIEKSKTVSQTAKIFASGWLYVIAIGHLITLKSQKGDFEKQKEQIKQIISTTKPYFLATKKHQKCFRKFLPVVQKLFGA